MRDGASAQYGSDAIAGVINFNLKDASEGVTLVARTGSYFEGDGDNYTISGNVGLPLGANGFISLSAEIDDADFTQRDAQYCEDWFCVDANNPIFAESPQDRQDYVNGVGSASLSAYEQNLQTLYPAGVSAASVQGNVVQPWGQPNASSVRTFVNAGYDLANGVELYGWANYSASEGDGSFFYRYPGNGTIEILRKADGSEYSPLEIFPGGFTPRFEGEVEDVGAVGGFRAVTDGGFTYDFSLRFGSNEIDYRLFNTVNPSYGPDTPTDFKPGTLTNEELQIQADFANEIDVGWASDLLVAYGVSYMDEEYDVGQSSQLASYDDGPHALSDPYGFCTREVFPDGTMGVDDDGNPIDISGTPDYASRSVVGTAGGGEWTESLGGLAAVAGTAVAGLDCTNGDDPAYTVVGVGSNGFPGYSPAFSEKFSRDSYAVYGDISADVTDNLYLQAAIRYEDYSDFGDELVGKIAGRVRVNDQFAIRASFGTGFRAPTPGQQGTTNVSTRLPNGFPVATGLFPPMSNVSVALGAKPLAAETSTSYTVGFTADLGDLSVTVDYYNIDIDDRFSAISTLDVSTDPTSGDDYLNFLALQGAGVVGAESIGGVFYFANAFDSNTQGVDVVASYPIEWGNGQDTALSFAFNWGESSLESDASDFLNAEDQWDFENRDPNVRWNLTANHAAGNFNFIGRVRYYGESSDGDGDPLAVQTFDAVTYFDLEASYRFNDTWSVSLGGRNIFDEFPDAADRSVNDNDYCCGRVYPSTLVAPWQGGYYYGAVRVSF
jgi:iron complex outermembrane receptor protein